MDNLEGTITGRYQKTIIAVLIGAFLVGGLLLFLWQYSSVLGSMSQQVVKNPLQQDAVSLTQIKEDYDINFPRIMDSFLLVDSATSDFASLASQAKEQILALKVPAIYKNYHLSIVLIFSDLESAIAKGDSSIITMKLSELRKLAREFPPIGQ